MLVSASNSVSIKTFTNCFRKEGISPANNEAAIAEEEDSFIDLQDEIDALWKVQPDLVPENAMVSSLTDVDSEVSAAVAPLTDSQILIEFRN